jgi:hypothetical protein
VLCGLEKIEVLPKVLAYSPLQRYQAQRILRFADTQIANQTV